MSGIFINYRRDDAPGVAGRLYDYLAKTFSRRELFIDVDAIKPGLDFVKQLDSQVSQCDVMLALIGPQWLGLEDERGRSKLHGDKDYVRIEIASALRRDIPVIPVLIHGATMPAEDELPEDIKSLARRQALELRHTRFASDAEAIAASLKVALPSRKKRWAWPLAATACLLGIVGAGLFYVWPRAATPPEPIPSSQSSSRASESAKAATAKSEGSGQTASPTDQPAQHAAVPQGLGEVVAPTDKTAQPTVILLAGLGQTADLRRTDPDSWEWIENGATFKFRTVSASRSELLIHDPSRDMYHRLDLQAGTSFWRTGTTGSWIPHYRIVSYSTPPAREQLFADPTANSLPLDGCLYFARECGQAAASAWCTSKGFRTAIKFAGFRNVPQTYVLGDGSVCKTGPTVTCGTFTSITCGQ
jgi:hypothetical protein